ncbi:hypothetical protein C8J56DRAFT_825667 [Mycena floridula]|nr:hypothetical protein C8J56DRAFT_825667 [Mycena floridula]
MASKASKVRHLLHNEVVSAVSTEAFTKNFRHLLPIQRMRDEMKRAEYRRTVPASYRIKFWNVVPGDRVRVLGDEDKAIYDVKAINRLANRVYVTPKDEAPQAVLRPKYKSFHYSRCQLFLGEYEFPVTKSRTVARTLPIFAQRVGITSPQWDRELRCWRWTRFAKKTTPTIPDWKRGTRLPISWPQFTPPALPPPTSSDTLLDAVARITYKPPPFTHSVNDVIPRPPTEQEFLFAFYNRHRESPFGEIQIPAEIYLTKELTNPHSRAKKQARWQNFMARRKAMLKEFIAAELSDLNGRHVREATADAHWKFREKISADEKEKRKTRWKASGGEAKLEKKIQNKAKKETKRLNRLTSLSLKEEPMQVVPANL